MVELTKFGGRTTYKVPPESTGSKIAHHIYYYIKVTGWTGILETPSTFTLATSGIFGTVHELVSYDGGHRLLILLEQTSPNTGFTTDEQIIITTPSGIQNCILRTWETVLLPTTSITDATHPDNTLNIDHLGAASVRFTEGEPQFDAYGHIRMMSPNYLAEYSFVYDTSSTLFQKLFSGTGTVTHLSNEASIALDTGTASGDTVSYTANRHYRYTTGTTHLVIMSVHTGDSGKPNNIRRWGYFNSKNGIFFELNGTTLYTVIRSDVTGSVVDTKVTQEDWTHDRVDGSGGETNQSLETLDITKQNTYWIDYQWSGSGIVRFGIYDVTGKRIVTNTMSNINTNFVPYMSTASLPVRWEVVNTGSTSSPSRLVATAAAILREGNIHGDSNNNNVRTASWTRSGSVVATDTASVLMGAFRCIGTFNGRPNKKVIVPKFLNYHVLGSPANITILAYSVFSSATWVAAAISSITEVTTDAVSAFAGIPVSSRFYSPGSYTIPVSDSFGTLSNTIHAFADETPGVIFSVFVKAIEPSSTTTVYFGVDWVEI